MSVEPPERAPTPRELGSAFQVYEVRRNGDRVLYFGEPLVPRREMMERVWPAFRKAGYDVSVAQRTGEVVLVAEPVDVGVDGIPWTNVFLLVATVISTLYAGAVWFYVDDPLSPAILQGWPFTLAVMGVLGTHELGHYAMSRYHKVDASLPYFIPIPTLIGTMGAVIKMKGQIPDRKALFDIGVAGPLAGLVATVVVTAVGLVLSPIAVPPEVMNGANVITVEFGFPPLLYLIAFVLGEPLSYPAGYTLNPIVIGGWVGMFVTFLNLLPVGQLDGGHILRAIVGERQRTVAAFLPAALFGLAGFLYFVRDVGNAATIWVFWGVLAGVFAYLGPAHPIADDSLGRKRILLGVLTFLLGVLCFTPVPIQIGT